MTLSIYDVSINALIRGLSNLSTVLDKAAAHAAARKFDPVALVQSRLFPDMYPLVRQVQIACDTAKGAAARLASVDVPKHEDNETTLEELKLRVAKTVEFLKSVQPAAVNGPAEFLFSRQHGVCAAAHQRRGTRQGRLPRNPSLGEEFHQHFDAGEQVLLRARFV
jgi:hypothetical protein